MTIIDSILQRWRIQKARAFIPPESTVLDIGCHQGEMLHLLHGLIKNGIGIDPLCNSNSPYSNIQLIQGNFPEDIPANTSFDTITALALVEHIPTDELTSFFTSCAQLLAPGGLLICTIPHQRVDKLLEWLIKLKLASGMSLEEHHGYDIHQTIPIAETAGLTLVTHKTFQLGLNNLFVFKRRNG